MSSNTHRAGGWVTVDWTIIALALVAVGLLLATTIRTDPGRHGAPADMDGGLRILAPGERLVTFEDFSLGTHGWTVAAAEPSDTAPPSVLGPFRSGAITKSYTLPPDTQRVVVMLDLHLSDRRLADEIVFEIDGAPVLQGLLATADGPPGVAAVLGPPDARGPDNPWTLRVVVSAPGPVLTLGLRRTGEGPGAFGLDTVWIVAETMQPAG